ncbi:FHA domain-containing protein [Labedella phragmitis]|uniref:FHA domain-containing protein n=1 Tax=Labedella phragmitis TaxID=2498849 RepID=A0A3S4AJN0_9MICO|nr:FHA domain-containing protein [Labedella phragmitis]RWZ50026.1 FHA domain-containing protein [Labedella phragmitis]
MPVFRYSPTVAPEWLAVAAPGCLLAVRLELTSDRIEPLVALTRGGSTVQGLLDALTSAGLTSTPSFVLAFWLPGRLEEDGVGIVARGEGRALVSTRAGEESVEARGFASWTERHIDGATAVTFELGDPGAPVVDLELDAGSVWVSRISVKEDERDAVPNGERDVALDGERGAGRHVEQATAGNDAGPAVPVSLDDDAIDDDPIDDDPIEGHTIARPSRAVRAARAAAAAGTPAPPAPPAPPLAPAPSLPSAPLLPPAPGASDAPVPADTLGDHDGLTVLAEDLRAARQGAHVPAAVPQSFAVQRYELELPSGSRQPLDVPVVLGRAPSVAGVPASALPHLVTLVGDDISRNHVRVGVEGGTVVVTDLHSSNGTIVIVPGRPPEKLRGGEPTPVIAGTLIDLGGGVTMRVRGV